MRIRRDKDDMIESEILLMASISDALAHPVRVKILRYIMKCNMSLTPVCNKNIVEELGYAQATISQHLKIMVKSGLLQIKKQERFTYYYVHAGTLMKYVNIVKTFE